MDVTQVGEIGWQKFSTDEQDNILALVRRFAELDEEAQLVTIYSTMVTVLVALDRYQPLLEYANKKVNGRRFGAR